MKKTLRDARATRTEENAIEHILSNCEDNIKQIDLDTRKLKAQRKLVLDTSKIALIRQFSDDMDLSVEVLYADSVEDLYDVLEDYCCDCDMLDSEEEDEDEDDVY